MGKPNLAGVGIRRLYFDIEVSPNVVLTWRIGNKVSIGHDSIVKERKVICICWKWEGESKVYSLTWDKDQDDKAMLKKFLEVANEADEIVGHFVDGFDMPWFRARCLIQGLEPLPIYKTVDTKAWAAKYFYFNSNKLDYLGAVLGYGHKLHTDYKLWLDVIAGCKRALAYMVKYCKKDVTQLEKVHQRLRRCVAPKSHVGVMQGKPASTCPHCGGTYSEYFRKRVSASGVVQHQRRCLTCKSYFLINDKANREYNKQRNG